MDFLLHFKKMKFTYQVCPGSLVPCQLWFLAIGCGYDCSLRLPVKSRLHYMYLAAVCSKYGCYSHDVCFL